MLAVLKGLPTGYNRDMEWCASEWRASGRDLSDLMVDEMRSAHPAFGDAAAVEVQLQELAKALREA